MNSLDPWLGLPLPSRAGDLSAKRVDGGGTLDLFWARDFGSRHLLVFHFSALPNDRPAMPNLKGVEVRVHPPRGGGRWTMVVALEQRELLDVFAGFCQDLVRTIVSHRTEEDAVRAIVSRMWRWHHLMRSGRSELLSESEQQGLRGELEILERLIERGAPPSLVLNAWQGPLGGAQDFRFPSVAVEVKAPRERGTAVVSISSEKQLDAQAVRQLFIALALIDRGQANEPGGETLPQTVRRIAARMGNDAPDQVELFETRLSAAGFDPDHDYSGFHWRLAQVSLFQVSEGFPAITPALLPPQVSHVRYSIDLDRCGDFRAPWEALDTALAGSGDA